MGTFWKVLTNVTAAIWALVKTLHLANVSNTRVLLIYFLFFLFILELCILDCAHGHCHRQQCICEEGWTGELCNVAQCDNRCTLNGQCNNGTCLCNTGWNGKHCTVGESLSSLLLVLLLALCCLLTLSCLLTLCYLGCFLLHSRSWLFAHCWLHACFWLPYSLTLGSLLALRG